MKESSQASTKPMVWILSSLQSDPKTCVSRASCLYKIARNREHDHADATTWRAKGRVLTILAVQANEGILSSIIW